METDHSPSQTLLVIGAGYVGLVLSACLAEAGYAVHCLEHDSTKLAALARGEIPIYEPGLDELIHRQCQREKLQFLRSPQGPYATAFLAVGTPPSPDGLDLSPLKQAARDMLPALAPQALVVLRSTVPLGGTALLSAILCDRPDVEWVYAPEFLSEGRAVYDTLHPSRLVIGGTSSATKRAAAILGRVAPSPCIEMDAASAEMTKLAANAFLATRIGLINEIAMLCETSGADIGQVKRGLGDDPRISRAYLEPGIGFGGACLPKDIRALITAGDQLSTSLAILKAVQATNDTTWRHFVERLSLWFPDGLSGHRLAVWGLAFKGGTNDSRESPSIRIAHALLAQGALVSAYDPQARVPSIPCAADPYSACEGAECLLVLTDWDEFRHPDWHRLTAVMATRRLADGRRLYDRNLAESFGFQYIGIGTRSPEPLT